MDIVNPNYLNYMEQIQKNRKDIEKLFDQELSDISQLNFKENDENGLTYENGKATFLGKSTIIRDDNTQNLEVDSKVELKISSGDDDIVIDAGEDNSTLEIHLDNETRNNISRALKTPISAPTDDEFVTVGSNNAQKMIPSNQIEKTAYKMNSILEFNSDMTNPEFYPSFALLDEFSRGKNLFTLDSNLNSWDNVKNWVQNEAPTGSYIKNISISGNWTVIIQKTSSSYASIVRFWYENNKIQKCKLYAGNWSDFEDV